MKIEINNPKFKPEKVKIGEIFIAGGVIVKNVLEAYFKRIWVVLSGSNFLS